jgi:hypothetical protein
MTETISIAEFQQEKSPHNTGRSRCLACGHEQISVAPTGVVWMQCSACLCGCQFFHITPDGVYCPNCGEWQRGF